MEENNKSKDTPYRERDTERSGQTGNIDSRTNNTSADVPNDQPISDDPNVTINNEGIGDSMVNNDRLTSYTSNHSADA